MPDYFDIDLNPVLMMADNDSLDPLVKFILNSKIFNCKMESLSSQDQYIKYSPNHHCYYNLIAKEILEFGGHSFINLFRGSGPTYFEIVRDVADKLSANYNKQQTVEEVELAITMKFISNAWSKLSDEDKLEFAKDTGIGIGFGSIPKAVPLIALQSAIRASGFFAYKFALIVSNALAKAILEHGLSFAVNAGITKGLSVFVGPIGLAISGLWTMIDLAGPAYRVTIPSVVHVAMLRRKVTLKNCPSCNAPYSPDMKYCSTCGDKLV
jgi:uncharacterized protein YaaW (UPF0174 family)